VPRGLVVELAGNGLLVGVLALRHFASILRPVQLTLVLVAGVHPLTGSLRRRGERIWLGGDCHPDHAGGHDPRPRGIVGAVQRPSFEEQRTSEIEPSTGGWPNRPGSPKRSDGRRPFADGA
jgi:hypothetical protein